MLAFRQALSVCGEEGSGVVCVTDVVMVVSTSESKRRTVMRICETSPSTAMPSQHSNPRQCHLQPSRVLSVAHHSLCVASL